MTEYNRRVPSALFAVGMNPEEREEALAQKVAVLLGITVIEAKKTRLFMYAFDGKSWEACQQAPWLTVDQIMISMVLTRITMFLDTESARATEHTARISASPLCTLVFGTKGRNWVIKILIIAITFSGHPLRTTVGNTWRM